MSSASKSAFPIKASHSLPKEFWKMGFKVNIRIKVSGELARQASEKRGHRPSAFSGEEAKKGDIIQQIFRVISQWGLSFPGA